MQYMDYKERRTHGSHSFPLAFYRITCAHPRYEMSFHWHIECEIIRVLQGEFCINLDNDKHTLHAGEAAFINSGVLHSGTPQDCVYECIVFDLGRLFKKNVSFLQQLIDGEIAIAPILAQNQKLITDIEELFREVAQRRPAYEIMVQSLLLRMLGDIMREGLYAHTERNKSSGKRIRQFKSALELIEESYSGEVGLKDMAEAAQMSPKYFCRFFADMTGHTPVEYLNSYRVEQACHRLVSTELSVTEIAYECGFGDLSYFIRTFKKYKGVSPGKYLKTVA